MELSVVIPCHGGVADTRACLRALAAQEDPDDTAAVANLKRALAAGPAAQA